MASIRNPSRFRRLPLLLTGLAIAMVVIVIGSLPGAAQGAPGDSGDASFDWSMPDRYRADGNGDGLVDAFPPDGALAIHPRTDHRLAAGGRSGRRTSDEDHPVLEPDPRSVRPLLGPQGQLGRV